MLAIASDSLLPAGATDEEINAYDFMAQEAKLLEKYANYPTLTEFKVMPHLHDGAKWGATFGVTLLVGELVFEKVKQLHPHFAPVIRQMFVVLLSELENPSPENETLLDPLEKALRFKVTTEDGGEVAEDRQRAFIRNLVHGLVESFVIVGVEYGIILAQEAGYSITPLGKRVLLHLLDAAKFIDEMTKAHTKFQAVKPKLSMT